MSEVVCQQTATTPNPDTQRHRFNCPCCHRNLLVLSAEELNPPAEDHQFLEYERPLLEFCKHKKRDNLHKSWAGNLLYGRYSVERVAKAIPNYVVVAPCEDHAKEAKGRRKVWAKFMWNIPGHSNHNALMREFYLLQYLIEHGITSVPMVRSFDANSNAKIAMSIMDALNGHLLQEEFLDHMQARARSAEPRGRTPPSRQTERIRPRSHQSVKEFSKSATSDSSGPPASPKSLNRSATTTFDKSRESVYGTSKMMQISELDLDVNSEGQSERRLGLNTFRAVHIADELLGCVAELHKAGVVCGDIRPGSILMQDYGLDGKTSLKLLDWGHGWVKDAKNTLGDKYVKDLHRISVNLARSIQTAFNEGTLAWVEPTLNELKSRLEYMSTEQFEQLTDAGKKPFEAKEDGPMSPKYGGAQFAKLLDGIDRREASDPSDETDVFMAGMTILNCFRGGHAPVNLTLRADLISAAQRWLQGAPGVGVLPRKGALMNALIAAVDAAKHPTAETCAVEIGLLPRRYPGIEAVLEKALQSQRDQRYSSIDTFREALAAEIMPNALDEDFLISHKKAVEDQLGFWPVMGSLTKPQVWRVFDVLTRIPRPAFSHVTLQGFHADTPPETIRQMARLFSEDPEPKHVGWRPLVVYWLGMQFPCQHLKIDWRDIVSSRMCEFLFLLIRSLDLSGSAVEHAVDVMGSCLGQAECTIDTLDLNSCRMFDKNALLLAPSLSTTPRLQTLNLVNNSLTDLSVMSLAEALVQNSSIRFLNLAENTLSKKKRPGLGRTCWMYRR
jgi:serine/threonine protein kinase